ncbi:MAG TPA: DNA polymerase III subunit gamma/tau [Vicinamibacteria bacterium]
MAYQVLARKYRPRTFDEVVGQTTLTRTLKNALQSGRLGHAFLLSGARGVGKTTTARILAKALNCGKSDGPTAEPCLSCASCTEITEGRSLDVQEIDGATNNGVEQVRELRESARYNPARDRFKVWIIDEVHMLSTGAFNALLKTLEEPPPKVKFIFATTEYHKLPDTILSRCQQYDFRMIPAREIQTHLKRVAGEEGITISDDALARLARAAEGSARDALSLFDQVLSFSGDTVKDEDLHALLGLIDRELLLTVTRAVVSGHSLALLDLVERLSEYGADYRNFARELLLHFRELLVLKLAPAESPLLAGIVPEEREQLRPLAEALSEEDLLRMIDVTAQAETDLRWAQDPRVTLELCLLKLMQMRRLLPFQNLVERVERLAAGVPSGRAETPAIPPARPSAASMASPPAAPAQGVARPAAPASTPAPASAPASTPAPPSVPTSSGAGAGSAEAILAAMVQAAQARPSLLQPLRGAVARLEGDAFVLEIAAEWSAFASMHQDEYRDLASKAAGRALKLRLGQGAPQAASAAEAPPSAAEVSRERLMKEAQKEPAVQEALDLFDGRLVDVREAKTGP